MSKYDLHLLGWYDFQKLCLTIVQEILGQTVMTFLDSNDAGKDGAFSGTWKQKDGEDLSSTEVAGGRHSKCHKSNYSKASQTRESITPLEEKKGARARREDINLLYFTRL